VRHRGAFLGWDKDEKQLLPTKIEIKAQGTKKENSDLQLAIVRFQKLE